MRQPYTPATALAGIVYWLPVDVCQTLLDQVAQCVEIGQIGALRGAPLVARCDFDTLRRLKPYGCSGNAQGAPSR